MSLPIIGGIVDAVGGAFKSWNDGRVQVKQAKIGAEVARYEAEAQRFFKEAEQTFTWDVEALKASKTSWKDEFIMLLWFAPYVMLFIPQLQPYAVEGFAQLAQVPWGYWLVLFGIVAQAFGLRWLFQKRVEKAIDSMKEI